MDPPLAWPPPFLEGTGELRTQDAGHSLSPVPRKLKLRPPRRTRGLGGMSVPQGRVDVPGWGRLCTASPLPPSSGPSAPALHCSVCHQRAPVSSGLWVTHATPRCLLHGDVTVAEPGSSWAGRRPVPGPWAGVVSQGGDTRSPPGRTATPPSSPRSHQSPVRAALSPILLDTVEGRPDGRLHESHGRSFHRKSPHPDQHGRPQELEQDECWRGRGDKARSCIAGGTATG